MKITPRLRRRVADKRKRIDLLAGLICKGRKA
jgi:hypothetical protein